MELREESGSGSPWLEILVEPQSKFRFRYRSEMTGKHGSLVGINPQHNPDPALKLYPTVKVSKGTGKEKRLSLHNLNCTRVLLPKGHF